MTTSEAVDYTEDRIPSGDQRLWIRRWFPSQGAAKANLLILHGYFEHSNRYGEVARYYASRNIACTAVDLRGHGRSTGRRGHVRDFDDYLDDVQAALALVQEPRFLLGHSAGGLIALDFVTRRQPKIHGLIVTNPYLGLGRPLSPAFAAFIDFGTQYLKYLSIPVEARVSDLTHDAIIFEDRNRDPLIFYWANFGWNHQAKQAQARVRRLTHIDVPLYFIYSDADAVASPKHSAALAEQLHSPDKKIEMYPQWFHEVLNEVGREKVYESTANWMLEKAVRTP